MNKYDVYSIGTAIVDYQYYLNEAQSQALVLDHGGAIIYAQQAKELLFKLSAISPHLAFGGLGVNTLSVISQLGGLRVQRGLGAFCHNAPYYIQSFPRKRESFH